MCFHKCHCNVWVVGSKIKTIIYIWHDMGRQNNFWNCLLYQPTPPPLSTSHVQAYWWAGKSCVFCELIRDPLSISQDEEEQECTWSNTRRCKYWFFSTIHLCNHEFVHACITWILGISFYSHSSFLQSLQPNSAVCTVTVNDAAFSLPISPSKQRYSEL